MFCKDCIHYDICMRYHRKKLGDFDPDKFCRPCDLYKAAADVHICMPGDTVYFPASGGEAYPATVRKIIYDTSWIAFEEAAIGKQVFLTKEAAERAGAGNDI